MLDLTQQIVAGALKSVTADASYATLLDVQACQERGIELFAPVQEKSFTAAKRQAKPLVQISRNNSLGLPTSAPTFVRKGIVWSIKAKSGDGVVETRM